MHVSDWFASIISLAQGNVGKCVSCYIIIAIKCKTRLNINILKFRTQFLLLLFNPFSAVTDFRRQILTSKVDPRTVRVKIVIMDVEQ